MKVMLLDAETTPIVSLAFAQSALMRQEVFLFERVQEAPSQEDLRHLKCIAILRPDQVRRGPAPPRQESLRLLAAELASPRYGAYHLHFTNLLPKVGRHPASPPWWRSAPELLCQGSSPRQQ